MSEMTTTRKPEPRHIDAWGLSLAGQFWPGEGVPVVALHGWLDNSNSFVPLAEQLGQPLLATDAAGHGLSAHRPEGAATHFIDHVRDVLAWLDACGWQQIDLVGHSMGAGIACLFAASFPERVRKLVLIEGLGPPSTPAEKVAETLKKAIADMQALPGKRKPIYPDRQAAVEARTGGFGGLDHDSAALLCERGLIDVDGGVTWCTDARLRLTSSMRLTEPQIEGFLRAIAAPTLLIVGEQGMGGSGLFDHRLDWVGNMRVQRLPGRHHLHMEQAAIVSEHIGRFLGEADAKL